MTFKRTKRITAFLNREELTAFKLSVAMSELNQNDYVRKLIKEDIEKNGINFEKGTINKDEVKK